MEALDNPRLINPLYITMIPSRLTRERSCFTAMTSESLITKCRSCSADILKNAEICPHCGKSQKRSKKAVWITAISGIIVIGIIAGHSKESGNSGGERYQNQEISAKISESTENNNKDNLPNDEKNLIDIVSSSMRDYDSAENEIQKTLARDNRKNLIMGSGVGFKISDWIGVIRSIDTNMDGKAIVDIRISPEIDIATWNNSLSDILSSTLIEKGSKVYGQLTPMKVGQKVIFAGEFLPSDDDYFQEQSITTEGSMQNPEFVFRFTDIQPVK